MEVRPSGPLDARIAIVGEAPGAEEEARGTPFVGASGAELTSMLHDAGIVRSQCFITNVARRRPPGNDISAWFSANKTPPREGQWVSLRGRWVNPAVAEGDALLAKELSLVKPKVVIALGNTSMWALTGHLGITSWRGSTLTRPDYIVVPTYHPAAVLRQYAWRQVAVHDLKRASRILTEGLRVPEYRFVVRPSFEEVMLRLSILLREAETFVYGGQLKLAVDIETRAGHIACLGLAWSPTEALCIPLMCTERNDGYWSEAEEFAIIKALRTLLCHPRTGVVGQNWSYDAQYIARWLRFTPAFARDTMLGHHVCWAGMPKGLDFLSSLYCAYHVYWKDEGKEWHHALGEDQLWTYNCKDCVVTYEVDAEIQTAVDSLGLREQHDFQQGMFWPVQAAMRRGLRRADELQREFAGELRTAIAGREQWLERVLGHAINPRSPKQMKELFYEDLAQRTILNRKTGTVTLNDEALATIAKREPLLGPLVRAISDIRSMGVFHSTFVEARCDTDGRLRCSFNIAGTETFRLASSQNAFGSGLNLQNIPNGDEAANLPNVRKLFIPDEGYEMFDLDLDRADAQVVAWESNDGELKQMLRENVDIHSENARVLGISRQLAKSWVHGTNYGGGPRTMAAACGITVHQAEKMRTRWFAAHPGIGHWHTRVEHDLRTRRFVQNPFGYRRFYFDRLDGLLSEALAWIPQSTVACVINRAWWRVAAGLPEVEVLIQVHDSLVGQYRVGEGPTLQPRLLDLSRIVIPYPEPLTIPVSLKSSTKSWGDCQ